MTELVSLSKASKLIGVTTRTLREWDYNGSIKTVRTSGGHRRIPMSEIERLTGSSEIERTISLVYCRVSTLKQKDNLERQLGRVLEKCSNEKWTTQTFKDIGSGLNENRKEYKKLLKRITEPDIKRVVLEYKDRLARFGFEIFLSYCKSFGVEVLVLEDSEKKEFEQELAEDMIALITSYSARLYGRRGGKTRHAKN
jgi:putative resolvase